MKSIHGVALKIFNKGVLIRGKSGVGKSELGLELLERGHQLIGDDLVSLKDENNAIYLEVASVHAFGYIEIRGIGFIDVAKLYGAQYISHRCKLELIIDLVAHNELKALENNRLQQLIGTTHIYDKEIQTYQLPIGANRNLASLVELIVRYHTHKSDGYDSHQEFIQKHNSLLEME